MANQHDKNFRESQMKSYDGALDRQSVQTGLSEYPDVLNKRVLKGTVESLKLFGREQFNFFNAGFNQTTGYLENKDEYPPEVIINTTLNQIATDLATIERAIDQRRDRKIKQEILKQADVLASDALGLAKKLGLIETVCPITYLYKVPSIHVIPYAPVALIGVPYSVISSREGHLETLRDYLAIPHEVGHYIYWHGHKKNSGDKFYDILYDDLESKYKQDDVPGEPGEPDRPVQHLYAHWLEEIFADVYACLVGGMATARSIQTILLDNLPARSLVDDGEHPIARLRPYIYISVLDKLMPGSGTFFKNEWINRYPDTDFDKKIKINRYDKYYQPVSSEERTIRQVKDDLEDIVSKIFNLIVGGTIESYTSWVELEIFQDNDVNNTASIDDLYEKLFDKDASGNGNRLHITKYSQIIWPFYDIENGKWKESESADTYLNLTSDDLRTARDTLEKLSASNRAKFEVWREVFQAGGWSSGGGDDAYPIR